MDSNDRNIVRAAGHDATRTIADLSDVLQAIAAAARLSIEALDRVTDDLVAIGVVLANNDNEESES